MLYFMFNCPDYTKIFNWSDILYADSNLTEFFQSVVLIVIFKDLSTSSAAVKMWEWYKQRSSVMQFK